jgi:hypothetical protein
LICSTTARFAARPCPLPGTGVLRCKSNFAAPQIKFRGGSKCSGSKPATRLYIHFEWDLAAWQLFASFGVNAGLDYTVQTELVPNRDV